MARLAFSALIHFRWRGVGARGSSARRNCVLTAWTPRPPPAERRAPRQARDSSTQRAQAKTRQLSLVPRSAVQYPSAENWHSRHDSNLRPAVKFLEMVQLPARKSHFAWTLLGALLTRQH